jgi:hypothetical protein
MEEETGEMKENKDTMAVAAHFLPKDQFLGFAGSLHPFQVTCFVIKNPTQKTE